MISKKRLALIIVRIVCRESCELFFVGFVVHCDFSSSEKEKNECIQFNHAPTTALILFLSLFCFGLFPFFCQKFTALTIFVSFFISFLPTFPIYQVLSRRLLISRLFNKFVNWSYTDHNGFACNLSHLTDHLLSNSMKKFNTKKIIKKYYNKKYLAFHTILFCYMKEKIKLP